MTQLDTLSSRHKDTRCLSYALALGLAACVLYPGEAHAVGEPSPMGAVLCYVIGVILGNFGRALATIAIISLGIGAMLGKVSWGLAITVTVGVAVLFGSIGIAKIMLSATGAAPVIGCNIPSLGPPF